MRYRIEKAALITLFAVLLSPSMFAQIGKITFDLEKDKPEKFKEKTLKSEKTGDKKFNLPRHFMQNTVTHYNYYFNANNKLNEVIERARISNKDNYGRLLTFYGYSLENTSGQSIQLDSVIYKSTAGILLHDLRSDWVDNLYLLIGKAYLLKKDFDSAAMTFQFINYNLYPHKKNDDDQLIVGSNTNGASVMTIANKENSNLLKRTFSLPPSRNDALVWQIRSFIEMEEYADAAGLINTLRNDPNFPSRLKPDLEEVNAYWFYRQGIYDSSANHLEKALANAEDKADKARWEFLLAQMFEISKQPIKASQYYSKAARHTTDPLMDIYANLNNAKMYKGSDPKELDNSIINLTRMAKRDKFESYRDIIYFSAGELSLEKPDTTAAEFYFNKSLLYNQENITYKNKAFLSLADINFKRKNYKAAYSLYDSLKTGDTTLTNLEEIQQRRTALSAIVDQIIIIEREDSLQRIAAMSPADRDAFIKKLSKKLHKEKGLKDEDINTSPASSVFEDTRNMQSDLFADNNAKGEWYFYNASIKAKGFTEFKSKWGKRTNVDNWRRRSAMEAAINNVQNNAKNSPVDVIKPDDKTAVTGITDNISYDALMGNLPTTPDKLKASNDMLSKSLFALGKLYQESLEDYGLAATTYEQSLERFPDNLYDGEIYMNLYYCYTKLGNSSKASYYKNLLNTKFSKSKFAANVMNPNAPSPGSRNNPEATKRYENIYNLFIEGKFENALQEKKAADSLYADNYWSPQLLYIESVYYIKQRQDSMAILVLNNIISKYPTSPLKGKAATMIDVLHRRKDIEKYLTDLKVERAKPDEPVAINKVTGVIQAPNNNKAIDTSTKKITTPILTPPVTNTDGTFAIIPESAQNVVMVLDKVDAVYVSEARNAFNRYNREKSPGVPLEITKEVLDQDISLLVFHQFPDATSAINYTDMLRKDAPDEISWLAGDKYSFIILSDANLEVLKQNKNLQGYLKLLKARYPGKF